jgi:arsenate reductase-like glutaredoxin family protein
MKMPLWKITEKGPTKIQETTVKKEKLLEENLEDWIVADPTILGEPLLVISRQVMIQDTKDKLDILALDPQGNSVVIELKRGHLKDPVDVQALRYASYISKWKFEDFENLSRNFMGKVGDTDFNFNAIYESFCEDAGSDEIPNLNQDQRIILVGSAVRDKLGTVALWLREHGIDITVIEVQAFKEADNILIQPTIIVPMPVSRFVDTGAKRKDGSPWIVDGKSWHLEKRCSQQTKDMFLILDKILQDKLELDGPRWDQKYYVAYSIKNYNWLCVITTPTILRLDFLVKAGVFDADKVGKKLGIVKFDKEETLSEKLGLPSSVWVQKRNENNDRLRIRVKSDFNLESPEFLSFLEEAYKAFPK